jgi:hypothetical protein
VLASVLILVTSAPTASAGGWKNGLNRDSKPESAASAGASQAQTNGIGGGRLLLGFGRLRNFIGNIARGGPGEGATPHISPTSDWKGQVNTNICNFKYVCQK